VFVSIQQKFEPKSATKRLPDGRLISPPLEDLAPFLSREELKENMYIPLIGEE
jgi:acetolactate synthase-1/2/3 large subunit